MNTSLPDDKYRDSHYLYPGGIFVDKAPHIVTTILGSCVAVCLWDPVLKFGGINHYMLPLWNGEGIPAPRYGNIAIKKLVEKMLTLGSARKNLKAKIFGGACTGRSNKGFLNVGARNIMIAQDILIEENVPVLASDVGGEVGRRLLFFTDSGLVRVRKVAKTGSFQ